MALDFANIPSEGARIASFVKILVGGPLIQRLLEQGFWTKFVYLQFLAILAKYREAVGDALMIGSRECLLYSFCICD